MKTFVLDSEAVAFDVKENKLMPFQELSKRKRKDVKVEDIQVRVCLFAFDLLYLNGEVYPFKHRYVDELTVAKAFTKKTAIRATTNPARKLPFRTRRVQFREVLRRGNDGSNTSVLGRKCEGWLRGSHD